MMLQTEYQGSRPSGFRQEDFFMFSLFRTYVKHCGHFCAKGHYLNKLGSGPLGDAT